MTIFSLIVILIFLTLCICPSTSSYARMFFEGLIYIVVPIIVVSIVEIIKIILKGDSDD